MRVEDDAGFWLELQKMGLPLTQMGGLKEGQGKLEIPRCRYWFLKTKSRSRKRFFIHHHGPKTR